MNKLGPSTKLDIENLFLSNQNQNQLDPPTKLNN